MEIKGIIKHIYDGASGQSASGSTWYKQMFSIETGGQYNNLIGFTVWNNKVDLSQYKDGEWVTVKFNIDSVEREDKNGNPMFFTNLTAWGIVKDAVVATQPSKQQFAPQTPPPDQQFQPVAPETKDDENLPF